MNFRRNFWNGYALGCITDFRAGVCPDTEIVFTYFDIVESMLTAVLLEIYYTES